MILKYVFVALTASSLGLLAFDAPRGSMLTSSPERGKVSAEAGPEGGTVRHRRFVFIGGGGFHGGK